MGRRSTIERLPAEQYDFVNKQFANGATDREVSELFEKEFGEKLPKSNLHRWRKSFGDACIERRKMRRFLVREMVERLKDEGFDVGDDNYKLVIQNIEDFLITSDREIVAADPIKLLNLRQEDERIKLKREKLELDKEQLAFEREKHKNAIDRVKVGAETMTDFLEFVGSDPEAIGFLTRHLQPFGEYLKAKYAAQS